ncbi:MAG: hypothetical protein M3R24_32690 [Chloroflexota bacterium]|nr:hypothetical protein [Chloroflexota bacterium]
MATAILLDPATPAIRSFPVPFIPRRRPRTLKARIRALDRIISAEARVKAAIEAEAHAAIFGTAKDFEKAKKAYERACVARAKAISAA